MNRLLINIIELYQKMSRYFSPSCRFCPSCSQYLKEAIEKYGLFKGSRLALFRLLRCNQFFRGGFDPLV